MEPPGTCNKVQDRYIKPASLADGLYGQEQSNFNAYGSQQHSFGEATQFGFAMAGDPMVGIAASYGQQFALKGKEKISRALPLESLKRYFDVTTSFVLRKLFIVLCPFFHKDWSLKLVSESEQASPRYDINAPDLYIPTMAFITYIFVAGLILGLCERFDPELLGLVASSAFVWIASENVLVLMTKYVMNIQQSFGFLDTVSFTCYKFVGMVVCLVAHLVVADSASLYFGTLAYCSAAVCLFLIRSVRSSVFTSTGSYHEAKKRKLYLVIFISCTQPFIMWWLTSYLISYTK